MNYDGVFYGGFSESDGPAFGGFVSKFSDDGVETMAPLWALSEAINGNGDCRRAFTSRGINMRLISMAHQELAYRTVRYQTHKQPDEETPFITFAVVSRSDIGEKSRHDQLICGSKDDLFEGNSYKVCVLQKWLSSLHFSR